MSPLVVVITGPIGAGNSTSMRSSWICWPSGTNLWLQSILDSLRALWPEDPKDPFHAELGLDNTTR